MSTIRMMMIKAAVHFTRVSLTIAVVCRLVSCRVFVYVIICRIYRMVGLITLLVCSASLLYTLFSKTRLDRDMLESTSLALIDLGMKLLTTTGF